MEQRGGTSAKGWQRWLGSLYLKLTGWTLVGERPAGVDKCVVLANPHTSAYDGVLIVAVSWAMGLNLRWMVKDAAFRFPFGGIMRGLGAIAIDRSSPHNVVDQMVQAFEAHDELYLAIAPAGTRKHRPYWKSGFYHIATGANVPFLYGFLDYKTKRGGVLGLKHPTGDPTTDMDHIRAAYEGIRGKFPDKESGARLRSEEPNQQAAAG